MKPGTKMREETMSDPKSTGKPPVFDPEKANEEKELKEVLGRIKNSLVVLSGKGGVGKSTVAVNLASALARRGFKTGLLDVDVHGPSVPGMLGLIGQKPVATQAGKLVPIEHESSLKVISVGFLMEDQNEAVVWRGPLKHGVIKQFIKDVAWGDLDYLIVDSPPGTGDEPLSVIQLLENPNGAVIVTTPQDVALSDVRKSITFCNKLEIPVAGVIENMSGFICPHCNERVDIFKSGGGEDMAAQMGVPFLGDIPIEPGIVSGGDEGKPFGLDEKSETAAATAFDAIVDKLVKK